MKRRWIVLALALLLAAAFSASAEPRLPDGFTTEAVLRLYNDQLLQSFMVVNRTQAATKVAQYRSFDAKSEDNVLRFANKDGQVAFSACLQGDGPDTSAPIVRLEFSIAGGVDWMDRPVLKSVLANVIARADDTAELQALSDWMTKATKDGETLPLNGYVLTHTRRDGGDVYTLAAEGAEPEPEPEPEPSAEEKLLTEIRDLLKKQK